MMNLLQETTDGTYISDSMRYFEQDNKGIYNCWDTMFGMRLKSLVKKNLGVFIQVFLILVACQTDSYLQLQQNL